MKNENKVSFKKEHKSAAGGLTQKGRDYAKSKGMDLKPPQPQGGARKDSYCSRSLGQQKANNIDCSKTPEKRICLARKRWKC